MYSRHSYPASCRRRTGFSLDPRLSRSEHDLRIVGIDTRQPSDGTEEDLSKSKNGESEETCSTEITSKGGLPGAGLPSTSLSRALPSSPRLSGSLKLRRAAMESSKSSEGSNSSSASSSSPTSVRPRARMSVREVRSDEAGGEETSADVAFMIKLKSARHRGEEGDDVSTLAPSEYSVSTEASSGTDTDTTLVDERNQELEKRIASLDRKVELYRRKIDRLEKQNRDLLEKQVSPSATSDCDTDKLHLQQRIQTLSSENQDLIDEKSSLELQVAELSKETQKKSARVNVERMVTDLRMRLSKAESLVEDLQEENDELKQEVKEMEEEMREIQDSFCEDQVEEYHDMKKQLEQANKNSRIIQFKLRKAERSIEGLQKEKASLETQLKHYQDIGGADSAEVEKLRMELKRSEEVSLKLGEEVEMLRKQSNASDVKAPVRRQSSASDENQLLRNLQDTMEREADLKEQLRFAEEESSELRKKLVRVEEENENLTEQLKKMANKFRRQKSQDKGGAGSRDEGIAEDMDEPSPQELKIQLELNETETSSLRRKVENVEKENEMLQRQIRELQKKSASPSSGETIQEFKIKDPNAYYEQKINVLEEELNQVRKKLIDREREKESLKRELDTRNKNESKPAFSRTRSLELSEPSSLSRKPLVQSPERESKSFEQSKAKQSGSQETKPSGRNNLDHGKKRIDAENDQLLKTIQGLREELARQKQEYEDLSRKHELLEEDYVVCKAQLAMEKEQLEGEFTVLKHEYDTAQSELKTLRETYNTKQDQWVKEKLSMEEKVRESERRWGRAEEISWKLEKTRLQDKLRTKTEELERLEKAQLSHKKEIRDIRKEVERQLETERDANNKILEEERQSREEDAATNRRKIDQLDEDLEELRSAHAKLRDTSRRVIRDRDRADRERAELLRRHQELLKADQERRSKVAAMVEQVEKLNELVTKGTKLHGQREKDKEQLEKIAKDLTSVLKDLNASPRPSLEQKEHPREKRQKSYRRSASTGATPADSENGSNGSSPGYWGYRSPYPAPPGSSRLGAALQRRAASMGLQGDSQDSVYQKDEGSVESLGPFHYQTVPRVRLQKDDSLDRVSTESTQSEIIAGVPPVKKKGAFRGLLRSIGRTKSADDSSAEQPTTEAHQEAAAGEPSEPEPALPPTDDSTRPEHGPKLRERISSLFKHSSPPSTRKVKPAREASSGGLPSRDASRTTKSAATSSSPFRSIPVVIRTPPTPSLTAMSDPFTSSAGQPLSSSNTLPSSRRSPRKDTPKIVISSVNRRSPLILSPFSRARAKFES